MGGPPDRLAPAGWMGAPATLAVIGALEARGGEGSARFVGGCVRNLLLGRPIEDVDIATPLTPPEVMQALAAAGLKAAPTGVEHGTVTAIAQGRPFEVTTLRRDVETDGRRAVVAFTTDWAEDAERRDFRLNALYMDKDGRLYDPVGQGVEDALAGRIVFVGDPETRIREDYLRILRFFRFRAWYGRGPADPVGLAACAALKDGLLRLSAERVSKELLKLLAADDPGPALREMAGVGVLQTLLPEARPPERLESLVEIERAEGARPDPELRLAALLPADGSAAAALARRLRLSNAQRERLCAALQPDSPLIPSIDPASLRRLLYRAGQGAVLDRLRLARAEAAAKAPDPAEALASWGPALALAEAWVRPRFPLGGEDAIAVGLRPGPAMGEALREAEAWWVQQDFRPGRDALTAWLRDRGTDPAGAR